VNDTTGLRAMCARRRRMASGKSGAYRRPCLVVFNIRQFNRKRSGGFIEKTRMNNQ
jgi:hypothetical protein